MNMQQVLDEFEHGLRISLCEEDLTITHDTLDDFRKSQRVVLVKSAHGIAFKRVAVVDTGDVRYCFVG